MPDIRPLSYPADRGALIGRESEIESIVSLLTQSRLVTLIGPGGIGKTSLAAAVYRRVRVDRRDWIQLTRLPPHCDVGVIAQEVACSITDAGLVGGSPWDTLTRSFREGLADNGGALVVLDNCEHVLPDLADFVSALLDAVPAVTILATSRQPLHCRDESIVHLAPLPTPSARALFCRRAEMAGDTIGFDETRIAIVDRLCRILEGNPLYIRLAAARLRHRALRQVLNELSGDDSDGRLRWRSGIRGDSPAHHNTVAETIEWSYNLCSADEQRLLKAMSIFAMGAEVVEGAQSNCGVDIETIVSVCADTTLPADTIRSALMRLVDQSLLCAHTTADGSVRFYLLDSIRLYARQKLDDRDIGPTTDELRRRHRRHYRRKTLAGQSTWFSSGEQQGFDWMREAWDDILLALETGLDDPTEATIVLEIATVLMSLRVPFVTGAHRTITALTEQALEITKSTDLPKALRVSATAVLGWVALWQGRHAHTASLLDHCVESCVTDPDLRRTWRATAQTDIGLPAAVEFTRGLELMTMDLDPRAPTVFSRARAKFAAAGDRGGEERSALFEVLSTCVVGDGGTALRLAEQHLAETQTVGAQWAHQWAKLAWVLAQSRHGDPDDAMTFGLAALPEIVAAGDRWTAGWLLHYCMMAATYSLARKITDPASIHSDLVADAVKIARYQGGLATLNRSLGIAPERTTLVAHETGQAIEIATSILGERLYAAAANQGGRLRPETNELQRYALGTLAIPDPPHNSPAENPLALWNQLSRSESDIAVLVAAGWTNSAIAEHRRTSIRTVDAQVLSIRRKLMVAHRSEVLWHVPPDQAGGVGFHARRNPTRTPQP